MKKHLILLSCFSVLAIYILGACTTEAGCTDPKAMNFNAQAVEENGSCYYAEVNDIAFSIDKPLAGSAFKLNDTVLIDAMVSTDLTIHGYEIRIINETNIGEEVFKVEEHAHDKPLHIAESWLNNISDQSSMLLIITAIIDHDQTEISDTVRFNCLAI